MHILELLCVIYATGSVLAKNGLPLMCICGRIHVEVRISVVYITWGLGSGGHFSLNASPFESGKKICQMISGLADAMHEGFLRSEAGFMLNWGPKVPQLSTGFFFWQKAWPVTMSNPT